MKKADLLWWLRGLLGNWEAARAPHHERPPPNYVQACRFPWCCHTLQHDFNRTDCHIGVRYRVYPKLRQGHAQTRTFIWGLISLIWQWLITMLIVLVWFNVPIVAAVSPTYCDCGPIYCDPTMWCGSSPSAFAWSVIYCCIGIFAADFVYMSPHFPLSLSRPKRERVFFPSSWRDMLRLFSISKRACNKKE